MQATPFTATRFRGIWGRLLGLGAAPRSRALEVCEECVSGLERVQLVQPLLQESVRLRYLSLQVLVQRGESQTRLQHERAVGRHSMRDLPAAQRRSDVSSAPPPAPRAGRRAQPSSARIRPPADIT